VRALLGAAAGETDFHCHGNSPFDGTVAGFPANFFKTGVSYGVGSLPE
jgi:hypothetical protein